MLITYNFSSNFHFSKYYEKFSLQQSLMTLVVDEINTCEIQSVE